jgi:hypothetical protein
MWNRGAKYRVVFILLVFMTYIGSLVHNLTERERRSLRLQEEVQDSDQVHLAVRIVEANPTASEVTARLSFRLSGKIAEDAVTPAVDVTVVLNTIRGPQFFDFPRGRRINPIFAVFSLDGNVNRYPVDRHHADIWIVMTTPSPTPKSLPHRSDEARQPTIPATEMSGQPGLGTVELQNSKRVPLSLDLSASIPGLKFSGTINETRAREIDHIELIVRRTSNVIFLSLLCNLLMMALAICVLLMAVRATAANRQLDLLPLSLSISLIFGLPALRNTQPGVPPLGVISDYVSFIWAENIVAVSAIVIMGAWLKRSRRAESSRSL